jgi:RNA polymerase sigma-70 factor, ECF subfamily
VGLIEKDEKGLIAQARNGNKNAFKELVLKYEPQVAGTVMGILGAGPEAEDVGQETFIKFYKSLSKFRGDSTVGTYLTKIAINLSLNVIRKRKVRNLMFSRKANMTDDRFRNQTNAGNSLETNDLINRGLQRLVPKFRTVIILRYINGYTSEETAEILNIPKGTVMSRLARGMEKLKIILKPLYEGINYGENEKWERK